DALLRAPALGFAREVIERERNVFRHALQQLDDLVIEGVQLVIVNEHRADGAAVMEKRQRGGRAAIRLSPYFMPWPRALVVEKIVAHARLLRAKRHADQSAPLGDGL